MSNVVLAQAVTGTTAITATAWPINATFVQVATATAADNGIQLPVVGIEGYTLNLRNDGASPVTCWPPTGRTINGAASYTLGLNQSAKFVGTGVSSNYIVANDAALPKQPATIAAGRTITAAESGSSYAINGAGPSFDITLPAPAAGLYYRFFVTTILAGGVTVRIDGSGANTMGGCILANAAKQVSVNAAQFVSLAATTNNNTVIEVYCADGAHYMAYGLASLATVTFA